MTNKAFYVTGLSGNPTENSPKIKMLKKYFDEVVVPEVGGKYGPVDYRDALESLDISCNFDDESVIVGSSLGGYWAYLMAVSRGLPYILINPITDPSKQLKTIDKDCAEYYTNLPKLSISRYNPGLVILGTRDKVVNYKQTLKLFLGHAQIETVDGDHLLNNTESYEDFIANYGKYSLFV